EMVLAAAYIPPDGCAMLDTMTGALGWYGRRMASRNIHKGLAGVLPTPWATFAFCNGMTRAQRRFSAEHFYPESPSIALENVDRSQMPTEVPRTWILTYRDRALPVKTQRQCIESLGGVHTLISIDTCHDLMISAPERLAEILLERCRLYA